jgi:hypothetical protein
MPLPEEGALSASQVATEFGVSSADIEFRNLGTFVGITSGQEVTLPDNFYGAASTTPTVQTNAASSVTSTGMTLNGNVTAQGSTAVTDKGFYFGTNASYASNTKISVSTGTGAYTSARTGLTAGTTYYINAYAVNSQGEAVGAQQTQATSGGGATAGSIYRAGTTSMTSIANRIIQRTSQEPTTAIRLTYSTSFTVNLWMKVGWTSALSSQGTYQHLWGVSANAIQSPYYSNVYNQNVRFFYREDSNRLYFGFLGSNIKYSQNFWFMHNSGQMQTATGLGSTYWSNSNRGNVNDNDYCMISITYNGSMSSANCKLYWNGVSCGDSYYSGGQTNGTPTFGTTDARLTTLLGSPYSMNSSTYGGTGDLTAGYLGGNGNTYVDEYSLWNSALSATDLVALYNEGAGGTISTSEQPEGLIAYYNFDSTSQNASPKYVSPIWPDPSGNDDLGKMEISGSSGFGSGTNTINGS